jgi:mRNA-degrading endonuclease RelE of RelBE toxin-antitoxin system
MDWKSSYASSFEKDLLRLPAEVQQKAVERIKGILGDPWSGKKLKGRRNRYSVRMGRNYRIVYSVYKHERLIDFEFVGRRKEAYRWFRHG